MLTGALQAAAATFNVLDHGAVGDDQTDNTAAFAKCMDALIAAGGGKMLVPEGVYRGRIVIPPVSKPAPSWMTVEIVGEGEPAPVFGTIGSFPPMNHGSIVKCLAKTGPAVISASGSSNSLYGGFSAVHVVLGNLDVRTYDNPGIGGIDLRYALQCRLENVFINTGLYNVQASKPTHGTTGLVTPANNNAALTILRNVQVTGYHTGILVHEHTDSDSINLASNINGLEIRVRPSCVALRPGRRATLHPRHQRVEQHGFAIQQLDIEQAGRRSDESGQRLARAVHDLNDPGNLGAGDINYWVVVGNVGAVDDFTRNGGATIRTRRVGSPP
ncbi:MAG: glycosyl hydrolase family 28-related protein [Kiritimatiellia bacterium]